MKKKKRFFFHFAMAKKKLSSDQRRKLKERIARYEERRRVHLPPPAMPAPEATGSGRVPVFYPGTRTFNPWLSSDSPESGRIRP